MIITLIAQTVNSVFGEVVPPSPVAAIGNGAVGINRVINNLITLMYTIAVIGVIFMVVWSSIEWIMSGGEKEKVASARKRLTWAIIGLAALALVFVFLRIVGSILGLKLYTPI